MNPTIAKGLEEFVIHSNDFEDFLTNTYDRQELDNAIKIQLASKKWKDTFSDKDKLKIRKAKQKDMEI